MTKQEFINQLKSLNVDQNTIDQMCTDLDTLIAHGKLTKDDDITANKADEAIKAAPIKVVDKDAK